MTFVIDSERQLAAPRRLCPLPPTLFTPSVPTPDWDEADADGHVPSFARQARALVDRNPTSATALARLGQAELAWDNVPDAAAAARAALKQSVSHADPSVIVSAAITLMACDDVAEAESALTGLPLEGPARVLYAAAAAQRCDFESAANRLTGDDSANGWGLKGWIALNTGHAGAAVHAYREVLRRVGPSPATLTNLGLAHALLGELGRAISVTKQALALSPSKRGRVGLNLASYQLACGDATAALAVLRDLQRERPDDIEPAFAEAGAHLALGDRASALRVLRRARTSLWAYASPVQQAELTANIAYVQWHLGKQTRRQAGDIVIQELARVDYDSLRIANMLPVLLRRFSATDQFRRVLARLRTKHPGAGLHNLELHLAVLERRFTDAADIAVAWAAEEPLDSDAATAATFLLTDVRGDYESAARLGQEALRRTPAARLLSNNVAYALALAGRPKEARRYLPDVETPHHMATYALIELLLGHTEEAIAGYLRAERMALDAGDLGLADLVRLNAGLALSQLGVPVPVIEAGSVDRYEEADDDPSFALVQYMIERRSGAATSS